MRFVRQLACPLVLALMGPAGAAHAEEPPPARAELGQCEAGDGAACLIAGQRAYLGLDELADLDAAIELFRLGCALGSGEACLRLGHELEFPDTGAPDPGGAEAAYAEACRLGIADACDPLEAAEADSASDITGALLPPELPEAAIGAESGPARQAPIIMTVFTASDEASEPELPVTVFASEALPDLFLDSPDNNLMAEDIADPDELAELRAGRRAGCAAGHMDACELYAGMVQAGEGGEADPVRSRRIYSVICTQGSILGCYELAWLFYEEGGALAPGRARFLFSETCLAGLLEACLQAGDMRWHGEGGPADEAGATHFYSIACDSGLEEACRLTTTLRQAKEAAEAAFALDPVESIPGDAAEQDS